MRISRSQKITGIIPAAGKASRLSPLPFSKELFPLGYQRVCINGSEQWRPKTVSQYLIERMVLADVDRILLVLGSGKEPIMEYYGNGSRFGFHIAYLFQEEIQGMPFALDLARPWLCNDTVLFGMPDTIVNPKESYRRLLDAHVTQKADVTLGVFHTNTPEKAGMVEIDEDDRVIRNVDKPKKTSLKYTYGIACWSPSFTALMGNFLKSLGEINREVVLSEVFQYACDQGLDVRAVRFNDGEYLDIGTMDDLARAIRRYSVYQSEMD